jgi:hypothetical protein
MNEQSPASLRVSHQKRGIQDHFAYVALHAFLVCSAIAMVVLQRYSELQFLAVHGYGVTASVYTLELYSAFIVLLDAWLVKSTLNSDRTEKILALVIPALFLFMGIFMILGSLDVELIPRFA